MTPKTKIIFLKISILWGAFFIISLSGHAQPDTSAVNTTTSTNDNLPDYRDDQITETATDTLLHLIKKTKKNARIATISSAIIPGLGQAYNGKYYKIPIIYGAGAIIYYFYDYNNYEYKRIKLARKELKKTGAISDPQLNRYDDRSLERYQNTYQRYRDYNILFLIMLYTANIIDAMVDSYMVEFDVSDDLSMQLVPSILPHPTDYYSASAGIKLSFRF